MLGLDRGFRSIRFSLILALYLHLVVANEVRAIGWGPTDFLITGAPNFPDRIGVFDQNFTFKGYLDSNFQGVQGMDFDSQGRLVALSSLSGQVRVYDSSGAQAGSATLVVASDLKVAPDGNYILGTTANGAQVFTPQGAFVRQYGSGDSRGITLVPGRRLWSGGNNLTMRIYDIDTGVQVGSFSLDQQTLGASSMQYSSVTNTVLITDRDRDAGGIFERDLNGILLNQFHVPLSQTTCNGATRGPGGHVFGTTADFDIDVVDWRADGTVAATFNVYPVNITAARILWAGTVPEPEAATLLIGASSLLLRLPRRLQV